MGEEEAAASSVEGHGAGSPRGEGSPQRCGDVGKRGSGQGRGEGYRMFGSTSVGSFPAQSNEDADSETGRKRSVWLERGGDGSRSVMRERQCRGASHYLKEGVEEGIAAGTRKRNNSAAKYFALQIVRSKHSELLHQRPHPG